MAPTIDVKVAVSCVQAFIAGLHYKPAVPLQAKIEVASSVLQRSLRHVSALAAEDSEGMSGLGNRIGGDVVFCFGKLRTEGRHLRLVSARVHVGEVVRRNV